MSKWFIFTHKKEKPSVLATIRTSIGKCFWLEWFDWGPLILYLQVPLSFKIVTIVEPLTKPSTPGRERAGI
jgi:hypothetical protein